MAINGLTQKISKKLYELTEPRKQKAQLVSTQEPSGYNSSYKAKQDKLLSEYLEAEALDYNNNTDKL